MKIILLTLILISSAFSQEIINLDKQQILNSTGGGNGGHPIEDRVTNVLKEFSDFFSDSENQKEFPEVDFTLLLEIIPSVKVYAGNFKLTDTFGARRCLLNKDSTIFIDETCWNTFLDKKQDHYTMIFHELLGILKLETAGKYVPSEYPISSRIDKYVHILNRYGLININKLKDVNGIGLSCMPFGKSLRSQYTRTLFLIKMNRNRVLSLYVKDIKPKMLNIRLDRMFPTSNGQMMILDNDFKTQELEIEIPLRNSETLDASYNLSTKRLKVPFNLWKSKIAFFEIPLSEILTLQSAQFNQITIEKHMLDGSVGALSCNPLIVQNIDKAKTYIPNDIGLYGMTELEEGHLLTIRNYFLNL